MIEAGRNPRPTGRSSHPHHATGEGNGYSVDGLVDMGAIIRFLSHHELDVPSEDSKGHSERIQARVHPRVAQFLGYLAESKDFPWKSSSQVLRFAILCLAYGLAGSGGKVGEGFFRELAILQKAHEEDTWTEEVSELFLKTRQTLNLYADTPSIQRKIVRGRLKEIRNLPPGEGRREWLVKRFQKTFKEWV